MFLCCWIKNGTWFFSVPQHHPSSLYENSKVSFVRIPLVINNGLLRRCKVAIGQLLTVLTDCFLSNFWEFRWTLPLKMCELEVFPILHHPHHCNFFFFLVRNTLRNYVLCILLCWRVNAFLTLFYASSNLLVFLFFSNYFPSLLLFAQMIYSYHTVIPLELLAGFGLVLGFFSFLAITAMSMAMVYSQIQSCIVFEQHLFKCKL